MLSFPKQKLTKKNEYQCQTLPFLSVCYLNCTLTTSLCTLWQQKWQYLPNKFMLSFTKDVDSKFFIIALSRDFMFYFHYFLSDSPSCVVSKFYVLGQISGIYFSAIAIFRSTGQEFWPICVNSITKWPVKRTSTLVWKISMEYNLYLLNQDGKMWLAVKVLSNNWRLKTICLMQMKCSFFKGSPLFC